MYIGSRQTNRQSLSAGLGESKALSWDALQRAVTLNRHYARDVGWMDYTRGIANLLGIRLANPDVWTFVQALADWQARNGMMPSGVLGPGEWYALLTPSR